MLQSTEGCSVLDPYKVHVRLQVQSNDVSRIVKPGLVSLSLDFKSNPRVSAAHFPCVSQAADKTSLLCLDVGKFQYWLPRHQWRWLTAFSLPPPPPSTPTPLGLQLLNTRSFWCDKMFLCVTQTTLTTSKREQMQKVRIQNCTGISSFPSFVFSSAEELLTYFYQVHKSLKCRFRDKVVPGPCLEVQGKNSAGTLCRLCIYWKELFTAHEY